MTIAVDLGRKATKPTNILMIFLREYFEKVYLKKSSQMTKIMKNFHSMLCYIKILNSPTPHYNTNVYVKQSCYGSPIFEHGILQRNL